MGQTLNNFTIIKSITIILVYVSGLKKNLCCFSLLLHTFSLCLMVICVFLKLTLCFLLLGYLLEGSNTLLSPHWLSFQRRQPFTLSSLAISLKEVIPYPLLLDYLFESCNTLLSPPQLFFHRWQYITLSFLLLSSQEKISLFSLGFTLYFPSPHRD